MLFPRALPVSCVLPALIAACASQPGAPSKADIAAAAKADGIGDVCAEFGWYGDGECDDFCLSPDPDCWSGELVDVAVTGSLPLSTGDGIDVYVDLDHIGRATEVLHAESQSGRFGVRWDKAWTHISFGGTVDIWVDYDGNGRCDGPDQVASRYVSSPIIAIESEHWFADAASTLEALRPRWCDQFDNVPAPADDPIDCAATCAGRGGCYTEAECLAFCNADVAHASQVVQDAFELCATTDPLCFIQDRACTQYKVTCLEDCVEGGDDRATCQSTCAS